MLSCSQCSKSFKSTAGVNTHQRLTKCGELIKKQQLLAQQLGLQSVSKPKEEAISVAKVQKQIKKDSDSDSDSDSDEEDKKSNDSDSDSDSDSDNQSDKSSAKNQDSDDESDDCDLEYKPTMFAFKFPVKKEIVEEKKAIIEEKKEIIEEKKEIAEEKKQESSDNESDNCYSNGQKSSDNDSDSDDDQPLSQRFNVQYSKPTRKERRSKISDDCKPKLSFSQMLAQKRAERNRISIDDKQTNASTDNTSNLSAKQLIDQLVDGDVILTRSNSFQPRQNRCRMSKPRQLSVEEEYSDYEDEHSITDDFLTKFSGTTCSIRCTQCHSSDIDIAKCRITCHECLVTKPCNVNKVPVQLDMYYESIDGDVVVDLRPIVSGHTLKLYCPTEEKPFRTIRVQKLKYQHIDDTKTEISVYSYMQTVSYINMLYKNKDKESEQQKAKCEHLKEASIYSNTELTAEQIEKLYQYNPKVSQNKQFSIKMMLDYNVTFALEKPVKIYWDIETTCSDGIYRGIPQPNNKDHKITMIQFLIDEPGQRLKQHVYHLSGYEYNLQEIKDKFAFTEKEPIYANLSDEVKELVDKMSGEEKKAYIEDLRLKWMIRYRRETYDINLTPFRSERELVDAFFNKLISIKKIVMMAGFNASHSVLFSTKTSKDDDVNSKEHKDKVNQELAYKYQKFHGYDLTWLTARSGYQFSPNNSQVKVDTDIDTMCSQIKELPNILFVDYQGLILRRLDQKFKNEVDNRSLDGLLNVLFKGDNEATKIGKVEQSYYQLQKKAHEQHVGGFDKEDMTQEMIYSVNDTICLHRTECQMNYLQDQIQTQMLGLQVSMTYAQIGTLNSCNQIKQSRILINRGECYKIMPLYDDSIGIKGAFTNNDINHMGKCTQFVIQDDYSGLYPSCIRFFNICPSTFVCVTEDPVPYLDSSKYSIIEVSDDKLYEECEHRTFAVYDRIKQGIITYQCEILAELRRKYKKKMEDCIKGSPEYNKWNQLQLLVKQQANAIYGASCAKSSPYYMRIVAASITSAARFCLQQLNRAIHTIGGFVNATKPNESVHYESGLEMTREKVTLPDKSVVLRWVRNMHITQEGDISRICENDTDSAFYRVKDMKWFQDALKNPERQKELFTTFHAQLQAKASEFLGVTHQDELASWYGSNVKSMVEHFSKRSGLLTFESEEFIVSLFTSFAKKSYARLDINNIDDEGFKFSENYITILNDITTEINPETGHRIFDKTTILKYMKEKKMTLTIKGVQWSCFDNYMRQQIRGLFLDILLGNDMDKVIMAKKAELMGIYQDSIDKIINGDETGRQELQRFAKRVKLSGKSDLVKSLLENSNYKFEADCVYLMPLTQRFKNQKQSQLWIPVQYITADNYNRLHDQAVLNTFQSQIQKFFIKEKQSNKTKRAELMFDKPADEVLIRCENEKSKWYSQELVNVAELKEYIQSKPKFTVHEQVCTPIRKLYFDIDKCTIKLDWFEQTVQDVLRDFRIQVNDLKMFVAARENTTKYASYHITFNVVMATELIKQIAKKVSVIGIRKGMVKTWIDDGVYIDSKTLRLPFTYKILKDGSTDPTSMLTTEADIRDICITYTDGYALVQQPMCFSSNKIIDFETPLETFQLNHLDAPEQYHDAMSRLVFNKKDLDDNVKYPRASVKPNMLCPACGKPHRAEESAMVVRYFTQSAYHFICYKKRADGLPSDLPIPVSKEQKAAIDQQIKEVKININQQVKTRFIPTQSHTDKVVFDLEDRMTIVQANMGMGKTEQLVKILKPLLVDQRKNCVMLSTRETLSSDWVRRYETEGIEMVDYRLETGRIKPQIGKITVIQVDSMARIHSEGVDVFILDELQSIITQLNSSQISDPSGCQQKFIDLLKNSQKVLCMDANVRESTVDILESLVGQTCKYVWNATKKYQNTNVELRPCTPFAQDHLLNQLKVSVIEQNKNVVCNFSERKMAQRAVEYLRALKPDIEIIFYHGGNNELQPGMEGILDQKGNPIIYHSDYKKYHFKEVNKFWKTCQVLIYTGTLSSGVNFTEKHFHENISCFTSRGASAESFTQGLMRVRNLLDNNMIIYIQKQAFKRLYTPKQLYHLYMINMAKYNIIDGVCTSDLFNLQLYLQAYKQAQKGAYTDIIVSVLNQMGMKIKYTDLTKEDMTMSLLTKAFKIKSELITAKTFCEHQPLQLHSCEAYLTKRDRIKNASIISREKNANLCRDYTMISFVSTVYNEQLKKDNAFADPTALKQHIDQKLETLTKLFKDDKPQLTSLVTEYYSYLEHKDKHKIFSQNGERLWTYTPEELTAHLKTRLIQYGNLMHDKKLKNTSNQTNLMHQLAEPVETALAFYRAMFGEYTEKGTHYRSELCETLAEKLGFKSHQHRSKALQLLGLNLKRVCVKIVQRREGKKIIKDRHYNSIVRPFFQDTIVLRMEEEPEIIEEEKEVIIDDNGAEESKTEQIVEESKTQPIDKKKQQADKRKAIYQQIKQQQKEQSSPEYIARREAARQENEAIRIQKEQALLNETPEQKAERIYQQYDIRRSSEQAVHLFGEYQCMQDDPQSTSDMIDQKFKEYNDFVHSTD